MRKNTNKGYTLMEMLLTVAVIAILAAIIILFLSRNLDRSRAAANGANLRAVRSLLAVELMADLGNQDAVIRQVLSTAPGAEGVDVPGLSLDDGTPMDAVITETGVDTLYGDYNEEDFDEVYQNGSHTESQTVTTEALLPALCGVLSCFSEDLTDGQYCAEHQIKQCQKSRLENDRLVLCDMEYRDQCDAAHYMIGPCGCSATGSKNGPCSNCDHWHYRYTCTEDVISSDYDTN